MNKRKVRCFLIRTNVGSQYNVEIFHPSTGGWSDLSLFICLKCGELFVAENASEKLDHLTDILSKCNLSCPRCASSLKSSIANYPSSFLASDGSIKNFKIPLHFSDELQTKIIDVWDITYLFTGNVGNVLD